MSVRPSLYLHASSLPARGGGGVWRLFHTWLPCEKESRPESGMTYFQTLDMLHSSKVRDGVARVATFPVRSVHESNFVHVTSCWGRRQVSLAVMLQASHLHSSIPGLAREGRRLEKPSPFMTSFPSERRSILFQCLLVYWVWEALMLLTRCTPTVVPSHTPDGRKLSIYVNV